jgi:hypothetical protein
MHGRREKNAAHFWSGGQAIKCVCFEGRTSSTQRYFGDRQALGGSCGKGRNRPEADSRPPRAANNADLPAGISALAVPARQKLRPIGVAAAGCPALVTSVVRRAMLRGRLSRLSHGNRGGAEIAPISCATTKQRPVPAGPHAGHYGSRSIEARAAKVERALGPNDDCAPPG